MARQSFLDLQGLTNVVTKLKQFVLDTCNMDHCLTLGKRKKRVTHPFCDFISNKLLHVILFKQSSS